MKKTYILLIIIFTSNLFLAQESKDKKVFLDSLSNETSEENYKYYRIIKDYFSEQDTYTVQTYYKSGKLKSVGITNNKETLMKFGEYIDYFENGNKEAITIYKKSIPIGKYTCWYENGNPKLIGEYSKNKINDFFINQYWNENNIQTVIDGDGNFSVKSDDLIEEGSLRKGTKDGIWNGKYLKTNETFKEIYQLGHFINGTSIDKNNVEIKYNEIEIKPVPKKGLDDFSKFISKKFNYTNVSIINKIKGKIILTFIVNKEGKIEDIKIIQSVGFGLDEEAIRVVKKYNDWIPGKVRGREVNCKFSLPINLEGMN